MAELADAADSKSAEVHPSWGFDPPSRHHADVSCRWSVKSFPMVEVEIFRKENWKA